MNSARIKSQTWSGMVIAVTDPEANADVSKTPGSLGATALVSIITGKLPLVERCSHSATGRLARQKIYATKDFCSATDKGN